MVRQVTDRSPIPFKETEIDALAAKIERAEPKRLLQFANAVAWNAMLDKARHARAMERQRLAAERARKQREEFELAKKELISIVTRLALVVQPNQQRHLGIVLLVKLERKPDSELAERFPGTTPDQRYQWTHRGVKLIWPHASERLRRTILARRLKGGALH